MRRLSALLVAAAARAYEFSAPHVVTADDDLVRTLCLADVDGDGDVDFLAAFDATVAWYANVALGFSANVIGTAADDARGVFALDLDGDGDVDARSASIGDATVAWYENDGAESFTERIITTLAEHAVDGSLAPNLADVFARQDSDLS
ncbi:hypothetical protein JL721_268 [Aureococcus anophagefferens]|nr:hypothetical protein JL721_268 [Aureococcus anophagefferens]